MNTPSHLIMTAALDKALPRVPIVKTAFLLGSIAPDFPLWMLSIGGIIYYQFILGWNTADTFQLMFGQLYFHNLYWIAFHNCLHSPVILLFSLNLVWQKRRNIGSHSRWCFWFLLACLLHSIVDILTHADDGPLLLFPLDWTIRFHSPVSYWDARHYGREFQRFDFALSAALLFYLLKNRACRWLGRFNPWYKPRSLS